MPWQPCVAWKAARKCQGKLHSPPRQRLLVPHALHAALVESPQAYDEHLNVVLQNVEEVHTVKDIDPETDEVMVQVRGFAASYSSGCMTTPSTTPQPRIHPAPPLRRHTSATWTCSLYAVT